MLMGLTVWHVLVILGVLIVVAIVCVAIIIIAIRLARNNVRHPRAALPDPVEQIQRLAKLRDGGLLSEEEYAAKRAELLGRI